MIDYRSENAVEERRGKRGIGEGKEEAVHLLPGAIRKRVSQQSGKAGSVEERG